MFYTYLDVIAPSLFLLYSYWVSPNILISSLFIILTVYLHNFPTQNVYKESPFSPKRIDLSFVQISLTDFSTCKVSHFEVKQVQGPVSLEIT
jgi:hypothetical protein